MELLLQGWITSAQRMSITPVREELGVDVDTLEGGRREVAVGSPIEDREEAAAFADPSIAREEGSWGAGGGVAGLAAPICGFPGGDGAELEVAGAGIRAAVRGGVKKGTTGVRDGEEGASWVIVA
jgi:hypothetical protein